MPNLEQLMGEGEYSFSDYISTEEIITHSLNKNTVECRIMVTVDSPDGTTWEGERVIKVVMRKKK